MPWRVPSFAAVAATTVTAAVTVAGCSQTVSGNPQRSYPAIPDPTRSYGYVADRCGLLADSTIQEILGAEDVVRPYSGAVCQYVLSPPVHDVVFSWFESGSLDRERVLATERGAQVTDTVVERHPAFLARRDTTGAACAATAAAGPGVLTWWVQLRGNSDGDPCPQAEKLLAATLASDM